MVEPLTPQQLRDLYSMLTPEKQREFLLLLGRVSAWEDPFLIVHELPPAESEKFSNEIFRTMFAHLYPLMLQEARKFARDNTGMSDEEFDKHFRPHVNAMLENYVHQIRELEATKIKAQRDRKSDPEIIKRNVEICDLRKQDAKKWTQGRLAKHFGLSSAGSIRSILAEEEKWRRLHAEMSVN